jgi:hypothetical protein
MTAKRAKRAKRRTTKAARCTVCAHADREGIERALAEGGTLRAVADRFDVSRSALERHEARHPRAPRGPSPAPLPLIPPDQVQSAEGLAMELQRAIQTRLAAVQTNADLGEGDRARIFRELGVALERVGRVTGDGLTMPESKIVKLPAFRRVVADVVKVLERWPDALVAVGETLARLEAGGSLQPVGGGGA